MEFLTVNQNFKALVINEMGEMSTGKYHKDEPINKNRIVGELGKTAYILKYQTSNNPPLAVIIPKKFVS